MRDSLQKSDVSRRHLMQWAVGGTVAVPFILQSEAAHAVKANVLQTDTNIVSPEALLNSVTDGVFINYNENPLGPSEKARTILSKTIALSGRYGMGFAENIAAIVGKQAHIPTDYVRFFNGSSVPLHAAALAFTSKTHPLAYSVPTFDMFFMTPSGEALTAIQTVPITKDHKIDVQAMLAAAPNAGLYYICNPNNPTGVVTPLADIEWLLAHKPVGSIVLVDEAYIHYSDNAKSALPLVAQNKEVIVLRTFSKIYGLAGLRLGFAAARPDLLEKLLQFDFNTPPLPAFAAAEASLLEVGLVARRKAYNKAVRDNIFAWLTSKGYRFTPSEASFFMLHVGKPGQSVTDALKKYKVHISGPRPNYPDWVRVSLGTPAEMNIFKAAFTKVMAA
ncbi:pyridoxal phosphate-dependent aminotransferase [Zymomonas mobilis]|uniref:Aminotransferase class I and II n=1 Tax=Zymomonas mobilis subsp. pomaceae (strain ATCC 29192 / DSM 22645 / JCM 10191 / CCUG 17912 / NBRC 13757 / NCIMB 11200 / NRRL B-4491 / Barker I) TaxID=579138 RepID=F8ERY2_ZYMMT|nr:pyridoxal phosphate-dependent aminotransferase [Zymomonas mobilis]AEI37557.1 aminotransferase class I and II [Zymomonas mobilis subsp. pomaceae ATCC 29192]MDX5948925.1 pyridoxal phosphate-dependent aminotransferase [Zymomonas mobilis subsp. pomaceae]GEB88730.1 aminotransferase [Zymomonas mobilis subsp. pomaceae]